MKVAIVGGGGVRVPLLINGLVSRGLPIDRVALFDTDAARVNLIASLARERAPGIPVNVHDTLASCVADAAFVVTSIRAGGTRAREHDENVALARGLVGQETVGPAGFAMAIRNVVPLTAYAEAIARHAPSAWVINFTNPVGIVSQAMREAADVKVVGICDTPTELFAEIAHALGARFDECRFDYLGLNHLGWVREVYHRGRPLLPDLWRDEARLAAIYRRPLFPAAYLATRRLLPTEYVYYYDFPDRAVANLRAAGRGRGAVVRQLTDRLFEDLAEQSRDPIVTYEAYLAERSASYMEIESGDTAARPPSPWSALTGYDRIAFDVMHAIVNDSGAVIPLNVANEGSIPDLASNEVVEVPCVVGSAGPRVQDVGPLPDQIRDLVVRVKRYEQKTIEAAKSRRPDALVDALAENPLVPSRELAADLVGELTF